MSRYFMNFATQEERKAWESEQKAKNKHFKVCMRMPTSELERDMGMPKGYLTGSGFRFATVYRLDYDPEKGY